MGSTRTSTAFAALPSAAPASTAIPRRRFLTAFDSDGKVALGAEATSVPRVSTVEAAIGDQVQFLSAGPVEIEFGGAVNDGVAVNADSSGRAVAAAAGGVVLGYAVGNPDGGAYASGDVGFIVLCRGQLNA